jgi:hypothetical protein
MRRKEPKRAERLRLIIDMLPSETRVAMLEGLERYEIIAGAYSDRSGGVCPMLAAHRCGGRTDLRSFARAWDRFTGASKRARRASERELRTLSAQLESSLWRDEQARYACTRVDADEHVTREPARRQSEPPAGAAWLIPFRDLDAYLHALRLALTGLEGEDEPVRPSAESSSKPLALV